MKRTLLTLAILTLNAIGQGPGGGQGQVKPDYFKYAPVTLDETGNKLHKISIHTRSYETGRIEIQYSRNLFHWYPVIFFLPPTQIEDKKTGISDLIFTNTNFGMRASQSRVFFRHVLDPDEVDYEGDLPDVVTKTLRTRLNRYNPEEDKNMFEDYESLSTITRCPTNFLHQMNGVTGIVAWNSKADNQLGGVAVTPRHVLCSAHAAFDPGDTLYFVDRSNNVWPVQIQAVVTPYGVAYDLGDYAICLLSEDLPDVIEPIKVLPLDGFTKFDTNRFNEDNVYLSTGENESYVAYTNQLKQTNITRISNVQFGDLIDPDPNNFTFDGYGEFSIGGPVADDIAPWKESLDPGDSGNPLMLIYRRQLILYGTFTTGTTGPFYGNPRNLNDISRLIEHVDDHTGVNTGYTLTEVDLRAVRVNN